MIISFGSASNWPFLVMRLAVGDLLTVNIVGMAELNYHNHQLVPFLIILVMKISFAP